MISRKDEKKTKTNKDDSTFLSSIGKTVATTAVALVTAYVVDKTIETFKKEGFRGFTKFFGSEEPAKPQAANEEQKVLESSIHTTTKYDPDLENYADSDLLCPISQSLLTDAVMLTTCGHTFQKESISAWLKNHNECPICKVKTTKNSLVPNFTVKSMVDTYIQKNKRKNN